MQPITYHPIGVVRSPFTTQAGMPIQTVAASGVEGRIELDPVYAPSLADLDGFSHLWLLVHLHEMTSSTLTVTPFLDTEPRGVFATRSPRRPNPIGLSIVRLVRIEDTTIYITDLDLLDGTPLLDIKPYVPLFDDRAEAQIGWFATTIGKVHDVRADDRFR